MARVQQVDMAEATINTCRKRGTNGAPGRENGINIYTFFTILWVQLTTLANYGATINTCEVGA